MNLKLIVLLIFMLPLVSAVFINTSTLNTSQSATSILTDLGITMEKLQIGINFIQLDNLSYTNNEIGVEVVQPLNLSESDSHINTSVFPFISQSNITDKNISTEIFSTINITAVVDVLNCNIINITYESNKSTFDQLFSPLDNSTWFCNSGNNRLRLNITGIETNENKLQINYETIVLVGDEFRWRFYNESDGQNKFTIGKTTGNIFALGNGIITGNFTVDTSTFFVDAFKNFVGIGTTNPTHKLNVVGSVNITGNLTTNTYYAEMFFHDDSAGGVVTVINTQGVWENITGFDGGEENGQKLNGFTYGTGTLTAFISGLYDVRHHTSFERSSGGAAREYHTAIAINGIIQNNTETHRLLGNANDVGNVADGGFINLQITDEINLQIQNEDGTENAGVHSASVTLRRIGDLV